MLLKSKKQRVNASAMCVKKKRIKLEQAMKIIEITLPRVFLRELDFKDLVKKKKYRGIN